MATIARDVAASSSCTTPHPTTTSSNSIFGLFSATIRRSTISPQRRNNHPDLPPCAHALRMSRRWPVANEGGRNRNKLPLAYTHWQKRLHWSHSHLILFITFLMGLGIIGVSCRSKPGGTRDDSDGVEMANPFRLPLECYHRYSNSDHHSSLTGWLHYKNQTHYSPISPSYHQALVKLQSEQLIHGLQVTSGASSCNSRRIRVISSTTPLRERALCQFEYLLNYKANGALRHVPGTQIEEIRYPQYEVKCSCARPPDRLVGKRIFECEPLRYQVRVLIFDEECQTYTEETETIALGCIPVLQVQANVNADNGADDTEISIPAEVPGNVPS